MQYVLPAGFTPQADQDFKPGAGIVLVADLGGGVVQFPAKIKAVDGGSLLLGMGHAGMADIRVPRSSISAWAMVVPFTNNESQVTMRSWNYAPAAFVVQNLTGWY